MANINHRGYPKFVVNSWSRAPKGLAHVLLGPSIVTTTIPTVGQITIRCETNYPFSDTLVYTVDSAAAFDLYLRIPSWANPSKSSVSVNKSSNSTVSPDPATGLHRISLPQGKSTVNFYISSSVRVETRSSGAVSVYVGNLLYALDVGEEVTTHLPHSWWDHNQTSEGTRDFEHVHEVKDSYFNHTKPVCFPS